MTITLKQLEIELQDIIIHIEHNSKERKIQNLLKEASFFADKQLKSVREKNSVNFKIEESTRRHNKFNNPRENC
jgi:hypothetical protein